MSKMTRKANKKNGSSAEFVGEIRFGGITKSMIQGYFQYVEATIAVGVSR